MDINLEKCDDDVQASLIPKCPIPARPRGPAPQADDAQRWRVLFSTLGWT